MRSGKTALLGAMTTFVLTACGGSSGGAPPPPPPPPPPPAPMEFTMIVRDQFAATSDTTDPVEVDDANIAFSDNDNAGVFDDLLQ